MVQSAFAAVQYAPGTSRLGHSGLFHLQSAHTLGFGRLSVGTHAGGSTDNAFVNYSVDNVSGDTTRNPGILATTVIPHIGYGLTSFLDLAVAMPIYWDHSSNLGGLRGGFGDLEISGKFQYPPYPHSRVFEVAFFGGLSLPTGDESKGLFPRHAYYRIQDESSQDSVRAFYTSGVPEMDLKMLWTLDINQLNNTSPMLLHVNFGSRFIFDSALESMFLLNLAFEYQPVEWLTLFTEFSGEAGIDDFNIGDDPLRLSPGISLTPPGGFFLTIGADINLNADTTLMKYQISGANKEVVSKIDQRWRVAVSVGWAGFILPQDEDHDGLKDNVDRCPKDPEDYDGFEDSDGCPDLDNDTDGIPDLQDKCPNDAEDKDGFQDDDGCPDTDNDEDGIVDVQDQCPRAPEDIDQFQDEDGCPDPDNDNDAVLDTADQCPVDPEDRDGFMDHDGCPEYDNDEDGVPDTLDKCPETPGVPENDGCPMEKPKPKEIKRGRVVLRGVNFEFGSAVLTGDSYTILEEVYESLREWPEVRVEIRGHTDSIGSKKANKKLSQDRAESVMNYLVTRGIDSTRLRAIGFGEDDPIADNKTAEGRALNRRVELHRID